MEQKIEIPLQWFVFQLHANVLLLRHFLQYRPIDGCKTTGPNSTLGSLTNSQMVYEKLSVAVFEELESEMPDVDYAELSTDQKYLHDLGNAVRSG